MISTFEALALMGFTIFVTGGIVYSIVLIHRIIENNKSHNSQRVSEK